MPIEIRELVIKVTVEENLNKTKDSKVDVRSLKKQVVRECMDKLKDMVHKNLSR